MSVSSSTGTRQNPEVAIVQSKKKNDWALAHVKTLIEEAFSLIGGVPKYVTPDMRVLIKPNQVFKINPPTTTNPLVVQALLRTRAFLHRPAKKLLHTASLS